MERGCPRAAPSDLRAPAGTRAQGSRAQGAPPRPAPGLRVLSHPKSRLRYPARVGAARRSPTARGGGWDAGHPTRFGALPGSGRWPGRRAAPGCPAARPPARGSASRGVRAVTLSGTGAGAPSFALQSGDRCVGGGAAARPSLEGSGAGTRGCWRERGAPGDAQTRGAARAGRPGAGDERPSARGAGGGAWAGLAEPLRRQHFRARRREAARGGSVSRCPARTRPDKMPRRAPWCALPAVLVLLSCLPRAPACPHPCACYVPTEVHCTFRSLAAVPAGIPRDVERINLGRKRGSVQAPGGAHKHPSLSGICSPVQSAVTPSSGVPAAAAEVVPAGCRPHEIRVATGAQLSEQRGSPGDPLLVFPAARPCRRRGDVARTTCPSTWPDVSSCPGLDFGYPGSYNKGAPETLSFPASTGLRTHKQPGPSSPEDVPAGDPSAPSKGGLPCGASVQRTFNSIQALSESSLAGLAQLELLLIHGNEIPNIPDGALQDLGSLQVLKFSYNKLRVITKQTLQGLVSLLRLHLDHNRIEFIHPQAFEGLAGLRLLHLEGNELHQLHPGTFATFTFLDYFRLSTVRHLYLADNQLSTLPPGMLESMPVLENLHLHGNPWACDCGLQWFPRWEAGSKGTLKCKKDKSFEGGQLCATCSSPSALRGRELHGLGALPCLKPAIASPLRQNNRSADGAEEPDEQEEEREEEEDLGEPPAPGWSISLNMTDEHGNSVELRCAIRRPTGARAVQLNLTDAHGLDINATVALDIECAMTRDKYEKLWKLIAYYSEVPLQLRRGQPLEGDPARGFAYAQDADAHALYYTGVRARLQAQPAWVLQARLEVQLDRRRSSARTVRLSYRARHAATLPAKGAGPARARSWVMIEPSAQVPRAQALLEGAPLQLSCQVKASESPAILWVLPDGSQLQAPGQDARGRFSALTSGWLRLPAAELRDSGVYRCEARVRDELARAAYRVLVLPAAPPTPGPRALTLQKAPGEPLRLPCHARAVPEAQLSWVLPGGSIVSRAANASHAHLLDDGTLTVPQLQPGDAGLYRCVAVNQLGADQFSVGVAVAHAGPGGAPKRGRQRAGARPPARARGDGVVDDEGGSGLSGQDAPSTQALHPKDQEIFLQTDEDAPAPGRTPKKGRRKLKLWRNPDKEPETTVAEGRRAFESRRRVNVASKHIRPEHWADILARVRGKSPPKEAEAPQLVLTTPAPPGALDETPLLPAVPPPSAASELPGATAEESSADLSMLGEEDEVSSTVSSSRPDAEPGHEGAAVAEAAVTSTDLQDVTEAEFPKLTVGVATASPRWPGPEEATPHGPDALYEEPSSGRGDAGGWPSVGVDSGPWPPATAEASPLHSGSLAEAETLGHRDAEAASHMDEEDMDGLTATHGRPAPTWLSAESTLGGADALAATQPPGHPDVRQVVTASVHAHSVHLTWEDTRRDPHTAQNTPPPEEGPPESRWPESEGQQGASSTRLDPTPPAAGSSTWPSTQPGEAPAAAAGDREAGAVSITSAPVATSASVLTTRPSPKRPHGRKRLRPHRLRPRPRPAPPDTSAPPDTFSSPAPDAGLPEHLEHQLAPTAWVGSTAGAPQKSATEKPAERVTKGPPKRKHRKRPHKHPHQSPTASSGASLTGPSSSAERKPKTPRSDAHPVPPTASLRTGVPRERSRTENPTKSTTRVHSSHIITQEPPYGKEREDSGVTDAGDHGRDSSVPGESLVDATSTSDSGVATVGGFDDEPPSSAFPGTPTWAPPEATQPGTLQMLTAAASSSEAPTDTPFFSIFEDVGLPSRSPSSSSTPPLSPQQEAAASTTDSRIQVGSSPTQAGATSRDVGHLETTPTTIRSERGPHNPILHPGPLEKPTSPAPTPESVAPAVPEPTRLPSRASPPSEDTKDNVLSSVGVPETKTSPVPDAGTRHTQRPEEPSTSSSKWGEVNVTPKQELGQGTAGGRTPTGLPFHLGGHHQEGPVQSVHQASRIPTKPTTLRGMARPPPVTTQSTLRYLVTFQPPHHVTNKPGITAYPSRVLPENDKHFMAPKVPSTAPKVPSTAPKVPSTAPKVPSMAPVVPPHGSRPGGFTDRGADWLNGDSKLFGSNSISDLRDPVPQLPTSKVPHGSGVRVPFFFNRTFSFPQWGVTSKPRTPNSPSLVTRERNVTPGPYQRGHSQGVLHVDFGPPAPPILRPPQATTPHSARFPSGPLLPTRSSVSFVTSSGQPSRNAHQSNAKFFPAGGPPASKFWPLGEKPQIVTKSPQAVTVTADTDAMLHCEASGTPKPFVTWTKVSTGALLAPSTRRDRFEVLKNGSLVIRRAQAQDRGQYQCTAQNLHGADRALVHLSVALQRPEILASQQQDVTVYLGDSIAMQCLAHGTPAPHISWVFPDGSVRCSASPAPGRVTLHENRTLSIRDAGFADRGVYRCVASNAAGADSLAFRLHVAALPPLIRQDKLENISLPPGLSVHIHCSAQAAPAPSVRWVLADGTHIRPSQFLRGSTFVFPNGTLYLRNVAPRDSGRYECVAANLVGSARRTVHLSVQRAAANARITGSSPQRTDVAYGGTLRLDCSASGDPWPRILWRLPSKRMMDALLSFDPRVKVFANGTLLVKSVTDKDAGDYLCVARNKMGDDFVVLQVDVVMKPAKIEHKEDDQRVFSGGDLKVDCVASGLPNPEISWGLPDGSLVNSLMQADDSGARAKRYVVFNNGTLFFNDVGPREQGEYTCFAENQVGKDAMRVRVKVVAEPPAIRNKTLATLRVPYGAVATVACEAKGEPPPRVTWLSPSLRAIPETSDKYRVFPDGRLLIQKAQRADSGNYTCVARNSAGEDRKTVWVQVSVRPPRINGYPDAVATVREIAARGGRALLDCRAEGVPAPRVLWAFPEGVFLPAPYRGQRVSIHSNGTLDIRGLRASDSGQLACIARNEGGEARLLVQLAVLDALEKPRFHDPPSEKITATAGHTISLNCSAAGAPAPSLHWLLPNGTEMRSGQRLHRVFHKADGRLHISALAPGDAGAYRCVARNSAGRAERLVSLRVEVAPDGGRQPRNVVSIVPGDTLRLHCRPPGGRPARVSWTLPGGLVLDAPQVRGRAALADNGTLTVRDASVFDRGTYTCRAGADAGPALASIPVIVVAYPPRITSEPTPVIYARPGHSVKMNCLAMGLPAAQISWELPDKAQLAAGVHARALGNKVVHPHGSLSVQLVTARDSGFYKCTATNILGSDSKTTYLHVY
ncbi:Matrix-remodeling-associated protein 5 [Galemys pyrenaicus]|uniref:Matrix-remodeling-associated protein 5 n=1 Tax=Galemys pyrenaicus TaxID=202257 RepID=A0A8J6DMF9_GALPY|nr:Matrix-remodeling-associated protein 5 [Galemys pyrenaicus]